MAWLLDTNVLSELRRPNPERKVLAFVATCALEEIFTSTVVFAELRFGIELVAEPERRAELNKWLAEKVRPMFRYRTLDITEDIMLRWRQLVEYGRKGGRTFSQPDLIVAATALEHDLTLITRNVKDFAGLGLTVLNPWDDIS